ncbi:hypothetical protein PMAYCL1PPCAC_05570, partial [Pristionchus mayeri]
MDEISYRPLIELSWLVDILIVDVAGVSVVTCNKDLQSSPATSNSAPNLGRFGPGHLGGMPDSRHRNRICELYIGPTNF